MKQAPYLEYPMLHIPAGSVHLRDDRINHSWTVQVEPFQLAPVPVTQALYRCIMHEKSIMREAVDMQEELIKHEAVDMQEELVKHEAVDMQEELVKHEAVDMQEESVKHETVGKHVATDMHHILQAPVVNVSWEDAVTFCNAFSRYAGLRECYTFTEAGQIHCDWEADGYRLPAEAEWQYACKAGSVGYRYGELDAVAWYNGNAEGKLHEVGQKQPNAWGLFDMLGNVWEWCWDIYDANVYGSYRIFRGGSWAEEARGCGATCRRRSHPSFRIDDLGFRVARSLRGAR